MGIRWIKKEDIIDSFVYRIKYAYPILEMNIEDKLETIRNYLHSFPNLWLSGRNGKF
jgi:protoporphyrinogen oxidase